MRLDAFISQNSDYTRSHIQKLIKAGRVRVDETIAFKGAQKLNPSDQVWVDDAAITTASLRYLMLHKPQGYVCANSDSEHPTVMDLLPLERKASLQIVGRLDIDTTGLVLITDDGNWNHRITSPKHECSKVYRVTTADPIAVNSAALFSQGIQLHGEQAPTRPAQLTLIDEHNALLCIHEGKYHQVKRMFAALGNRVTGLHRQSIGPQQLDAELQPGQWRALSASEVAQLSNTGTANE